MFSKPCDSRIIGVHKVFLRHSSMKLVSSATLKKQAVVLSFGDSLLFLEILHLLN